MVRAVAPAIGLARQRRFPRDAGLAYTFVLPVVLILLILVGYPFLTALWQSLHAKMLGDPNAPFVGLDNYVKNFENGDFRNSIRVTLTYTIGAEIGKIFFGLLAAIILNERLPGRNYLRGVMILPWALPGIATTLSWMWILSGSYGVLNMILRNLGLISENIAWLGTPTTALFAVTAVNVWRGFPFFAMTLLAGLQSIPVEFYEAASVDGAGTLQRFRHITLPSIMPVLAVITLLSTILTLNDFALIWVLTNGGPSIATTTMSILTVRTAFAAQEIGRAVSISVTLMPLLIVLIMLLVRTLSRGDAR